MYFLFNFNYVGFFYYFVKIDKLIFLKKLDANVALLILFYLSCQHLVCQ